MQGWGWGVVFAALCGVGAPVVAAPVSCPAALTVQQTAPSPPVEMKPADMKPVRMKMVDIAPDHPWTNVQFSDGPPEQEAWLAPDNAQRRGKETVNTWRFSPSADGVWLSCIYTGTSLAAAFRLPDTVRGCEVRYDETVSPAAAKSVTCQ
jgi:hypothetical protein